MTKSQKPKKKLARETGLAWAYLRKDGTFFRANPSQPPVVERSHPFAESLCSNDERVVRVRWTLEQVR